MRRRLILIVLAVTSMVAVAFVVPLAGAVEVVAADRALAVADQEAQSLAGVLAAEPSATAVAAVLAQLNASSPRQAAAFLPSGQRVGADITAPAAELAEARGGRAFTASGGGEHRVWVAVRLPGGQMTVGVVAVPDSQLTRGVLEAWLVLGAVAVFILAAGLLLADWLGRSIVAPVRELVEVTRRLRSGQIDARVVPAGPAEAADLGTAVNELADRITDLVASEREAVADLSHGLRTPLAALRLEADSIRSRSDRDRISQAIAEVSAAVDELIHQVRRGGPVEAPACDDLVAVIRQRLDFWSLLAAEQGRSVEISLPDEVVPIAIGDARVSTMVDALVGNVFAHTPTGAGFRIRLDTTGGWAVLTLEDDGPGFPTGFALGRGSSGAGSTGLGLDIARRTANSGGGDLRAANSPTGGASVQVRLRPGPAGPAGRERAPAVSGRRS